MKVKTNPTEGVMFFGAWLWWHELAAGSCWCCVGRDKSWSWLQVVFYGPLAHESADCSGKHPLINPTFLGNIFVWGQPCSSPGVSRVAPGPTECPPWMGTRTPQVLGNSWGRCCSYCDADWQLSWKHLEHSLFKGNVERFSPFQTETKFQLPQCIHFLGNLTFQPSFNSFS